MPGSRPTSLSMVPGAVTYIRNLRMAVVKVEYHNEKRGLKWGY
jgi:hypothetical protein